MSFTDEEVAYLRSQRLARVATVSADLLAAEVRHGHVDDMLKMWRESVGRVTNVISLTFKEPQTGPAGLPIEIRLQGDDADELKAAAEAERIRDARGPATEVDEGIRWRWTAAEAAERHSAVMAALQPLAGRAPGW